VSTRTVRYYEEIGLLETARRFAGGRRVFEADALQRLKFIARLKGLGFSLDEIRHLNEVFALHRSTKDMLGVLDGLLAGHLLGLARQMEALGGARRELLAYRQRIRARLALLRGKDNPAAG
jgi:DNA-binding transcriptional MerR regulator